MIKELHHTVSKDDDLPFLVRAPILLASNMVFQSLGYMDSAERSYKAGQNALLAGIVYNKFYNSSVLAAAIVGHSLGFILNGHIPLILRGLGLIYTPPERFKGWLRLLTLVGERTASISAIGVYGSLSRGELGPGSDLDVRVIRRSGISNALESCFVVNLLRFAATVTLFPLDIYVIDSVDKLSRLRDDECVQVLVDKDDMF